MEKTFIDSAAIPPTADQTAPATQSIPQEAIATTRRSKAGRGFPVLHVRFEPELHRRLKTRASNSNITMQDLIRNAVIDFIDDGTDKGSEG